MNKISVVLPILSISPFIVALTEFCIATLRAHADNPFDLILVEGGKPNYRDRDEQQQASVWGVDKYLGFNPKIGGVKEINAGIRAATTEFVLLTGNDVIVPPHWDTELLRCFEERPDCGLASLSAFEPGATIGPDVPQDRIVEGMYSPFNMFRRQTVGGLGGVAMVRDWEYDEHFVRVYQDSDFVMRFYEAGFRAYRSCRAHVHHLLRMTTDRMDPVENAKHHAMLRMDEERFYARWGKSPLAIFGLIRAGQYTYSREYLSFMQPVGDGSPQHPANRVR